MSDVFDTELELSQDLGGQNSVDAPSMNGPEASQETKPKKKGLIGSLFSMDIYNVMLLVALLFIIFATLHLLGVLRTYNPSFPFDGSFPWSTNNL